MFVRKPRSHASGSSNLSLNVFNQESYQKLNTTRTPLTSEFKGKRLADIMLRRMNTEQSPPKTTEQFYRSEGKQLKEKTLVGYPRTAQLEEKDKRKLCFTGESELLFDKRLEKYREGDHKFKPRKEKAMIKKEHLIKEKHNVHGTAIQETQLVGYDKYANDTLKNNVNLEKVREARRILRRRYANRANLQRIYAAWDDDRTGTINHANVYNMSKKLGLNLNVDEARVLLASANRSGTGELTIDEFLDLIYNKDDALNVDLDQLSSNLDANYLIKREELDGGDNIIQKLQEDAKKTRENRHINQVSLVLKNKYNSVVQFMLIADPAKQGYINYEKFYETIKRLDINDQIVSEADIRRLFNKYICEDQHTTNYRAFLEDLKNFRFKHEEMYMEYKPEAKKKMVEDPIDLISNEIHISDAKNAPYNVVMEHIGKAEKINTGIKRYFPTKDDLKVYVAETLNVEKEGVENQPLSQKELKDLVVGLFKNFDNSIVRKEHFEGFLSSFMYNNHGFTNVDELLQTVYNMNDKTHFAKLAKLKPNAPPHPAISGLDEEKDLVQSEVVDLGKSEFQRMRNRTEGDETLKEKLNYNASTDKALGAILTKLDNKLYVDRKSQYEFFKSFDKDADGYVSHKDLAKKLGDMALLNKTEIPKLLSYVDPENKGYVNFKEFHKRIHSNMINANSFGELYSPSNMYPTREFNTLISPKIKEYTLRINEIVKKQHPYYQYNLNSSTRYGATPNWSNTFYNMQASSNSPMFASEEQRFDKQHQHRLIFQKEELVKKQLTELSRVKSLQLSNISVADRIEKENSRLEKLNNHNIAKKKLENALYDQRAKLRNEFAN